MYLGHTARCVRRLILTVISAGGSLYSRNPTLLTMLTFWHDANKVVKVGIAEVQLGLDKTRCLHIGHFLLRSKGCQVW
jgi:hypothetical protein